jgi:hypothetical protein
MTLGLGQRRGMLDKGEGLGEILEPVSALDAGRFFE